MTQQAATTNSATRRRVSVADAALHANVSKRTIRRWISEGRLTAYRMGPRLIHVYLEDIDALEERLPCAADYR